MLRFTHKLPDEPYAVAVSGGADSMAVLDFLQNHRVKPALVINCNHNTVYGAAMENFLAGYCKERKLEAKFFHITDWRQKDAKESWEEYWRLFRLECFYQVKMPVITAHNLDDVCESWIFGSLHGDPKLIPYRNQNIIRPFRPTPKAEMLNWCHRRSVPYFDDPSNTDTKYMRNLIRHEIMPKALMVNPGLRKVILKKILEECNQSEKSNSGLGKGS